VLKVSINCVETYSTDQMNGFDRFNMLIGDIESTWKSLASGTVLANARPVTSQEAQQLPAAVQGSDSPTPPTQPQTVSERETAMDGEGGRLPIGPPVDEREFPDLGLG
jgi:hypothetical protein